MSSKRIVTGARYGLKDWMLQRITALVMVVYTVIMLVALFSLKELSYGTWAGLFASPWIKVLTLVMAVCLLYHAWVGVRDIYMDYIKPTGLRILLQVASVLLLLGYLAWLAIILWRV
jgi:succinate dehydrogenase / fumarate reductase, membrane anchor subunit